MSTNELIQAKDFVAAAMQELGVLAAGETPSAEDTQDGIRALQWMLKGWQARGVTSWRQQDTTVVIPAGVASVTLDQGVFDVSSVRMGNVTSRPLFRIERGRYLELPNKTQRGIPTLYTSHQDISGVKLTVWPTPSVDTTLYLDAVRTIADVVSPSDTLDVPQQWTECVYIALAARMANMEGVTRTNPAAAQFIVQRAQALETALFDADRTSIYMGA